MWTRPSRSLEQAKVKGHGVGSNVDLRRNKIQSSVFLTSNTVITYYLVAC